MLTALRTILQAAAKSLGVERAAYSAMIDELWDEVVGPQVAAYTVPSGLRGDLLWVDAESGPWAQDLTLQRTKVAGDLNARLGSVVIRDIRVRQRVGVVTRRRRTPRPVPIPADDPELSPEELASIDRAAAEIPDEDLRAAEKRAMLSQWRWRKRQRPISTGAR
jgi:hypothetical protein